MMDFKRILERLFSVERAGPAFPVGPEQDLSDEEYDAGPTEVQIDTTDLAPAEVVVATPVATIARPSRSWSSQSFTATVIGEPILVAGRNPFRTRLMIRVGTGDPIRIGPSRESVNSGGTFTTGATVELGCMAEVWASLESGSSASFTVVCEFEDGGNG